MKRTSRQTSKLSESLHRQLNSYALAASAAGVSMMALTQSADAKIIYTPANVKITDGGTFHMDVNHDGVNDFYFFNTSGCRTSCDLLHVSASSFKYGAAVGNGSFVAALRPGVRINKSQQFAEGNYMAVVRFFSSKFIYAGPWANGGKGVTDRYLGLKFNIGSKIHFGWARLRVQVKKHANGSPYFFTTLTGYAYETIPNKPIIAGKTHGPDVIVRHATLGELAAGRK
jgi:hypothetical protein